MVIDRKNVVGAVLIASAAALGGCFGDMTFSRDGQFGEQPTRFGVDAGPIPEGLDFACADPVATEDDGHHFAGADCRSGCHDGTTAPPFSVAGTLYTDSSGTVPAVGATVHVRDAADNLFELTTATNGNFHLADPVELPLIIYASSCPTTSVMPTYTDYGSCNGCHDDSQPAHL